MLGKSRPCKIGIGEGQLSGTLPEGQATAMTGRSTLKNATHLSVCYRVSY
jgi:hypothetical protein